VAIPFDQAFKLVHDDDPRAGMAAFLGIPLSLEMDVEPLDRELNLSTLRTDQLFRCRTAHDEFAIHVEALSRFKAEAFEKQLKYAMAITLKYDLPLHSHIVLLTDRDLPAGPLPMPETSKGDLRASLHIRITKLWEIPASRILGLDNPSLLPWAPLLAARDEELQDAAGRIVALKNRELSAELVLLGGLRYGSKEAFLERINRLMTTEEILEDSVFYQEIMEKGRKDGARQALITLLTVRFGELPGRLRNRVASADVETLDRWIRQVLTAPTADAALS